MSKHSGNPTHFLCKHPARKSIKTWEVTIAGSEILAVNEVAVCVDDSDKEDDHKEEERKFSSFCFA